MISDLIKAANQPRTDARVRLPQLREALAARFKEVVGEEVDPWDLSHLATQAYEREENGTPFDPEAWDDALKAEADFVSKYLDANGAEEVKQVTSKQDMTLDERAAEAVEAAWPGDPRSHGITKTVLVKARGYIQAGLTEAQAVSKAVDSLTPTAMRQVAKELQDKGLSPDEAQREAGRAAMRLNQRRLAERAAAVKKEADPEVVACAAIIQKSRIAAGLTQEQLANEVGVTTRAVQHWEAGQRLPQGITAWRLANALEWPIETLREVGRIQRRTERD